MDSVPSRRPLALYSSTAKHRRIRASGSRFELGYQHGVIDRVEIQRFLADHSARVGVLAGASRLATLADSIAQYAKVIEATLPGMAEEVHGLAKGAEIQVEDAYLLQLRRELVGYQSVRAQGDCTTFGRLVPGNTILAQTIDLNGNMEPELTAMELEHERSGRRVLLASFTGLLGYLGMNDSGVAICLNLVLAGTWQPGIPGYMAIRHLLDEASSVDECLDILASLPLASSRALTISDGTRLVTVEYVLGERSIFEGNELVHTNHFLDPEFAKIDELNPFARTSSLRRLNACISALDNLPVNADVEEYFGVLETPPIYVQPNGDVRRECTVGAVIMHPDAGTMFIKQRGSEILPIA